MPYIYSLNGMVHFNDYTMMRPLVMDFTADVRTHDIWDQFMFGPAFMAAPVTEYNARKRDVYFPQGEVWYDFHTGKSITGGDMKTVDAPYSRMPLYVRSGSIVPFGPDIQWSDQKPAEEITLYVYAGKDGKFTLYEDENNNYNYEKGAYATIDFLWDDAASTLTIGARKGKFPGMLAKRKFTVVKVDRDNPASFDTMPKGKRIEYGGKKVSVKL